MQHGTCCLPACWLPRRLAGQFNKINDCVDDDVVISRTLQPIRCVSENVYGAQCRSDYILLLVASRQQYALACYVDFMVFLGNFGEFEFYLRKHTQNGLIQIEIAPNWLELIEPMWAKHENMNLS